MYKRVPVMLGAIGAIVTFGILPVPLRERILFRKRDEHTRRIARDARQHIHISGIDN